MPDSTLNTTRLRDAIEFYEHSPDGQYDNDAAEAMRCLLWLIEQPAPVQDAVLRPPIPENMLEHPEKWPDIVLAGLSRSSKGVD